VTSSSASTPRGSFDRSSARTDPGGSTSSTPARRTSSSLGPRPAITTVGSYFPPSTSNPNTSIPSLPRRDSIGETAIRAGWMRGPGGVGTFSKNVRKPGPANDGFNSWAKKHLPKSFTIDNLPSISVMGSETANFGFGEEDLGSIAERGGSGAITPSAGTSPGGLGLENAAAAVEGWMRKLAVKTPGTPRLSPSRIGRGGTSTQVDGDLIELLDGPGSDDGRTFEALDQRAAEMPRSMPIPVRTASAREEPEGMRGRLPAGGGKGKKSD